MALLGRSGDPTRLGLTLPTGESLPTPRITRWQISYPWVCSVDPYPDVHGPNLHVQSANRRNCAVFPKLRVECCFQNL